MRKKITLKVIAKEFDVSVSTVSKALKNSPEISRETKERIHAFAEFYNYRPNTTALSLKNQNTKTIGVILPEVVHHFFASVIKGIEKAANERGYKVIICLSNNSIEKEALNLGLLADGSIEGFVLSVAKETQQKKDYQHIENAIRQGFPVVMFDRVIEELHCDKVIIDDKAGARRAVDYLIERGCRKIGVITTPDYLNVGKLRTEGYKEAHTLHNLSFSEDTIVKVEDDEEALGHIEQFIESQDIDGVLAVNEKYAAYAARAIRKVGKKIPEDVSIITFTDGDISKLFIPSFTTVNQNGEQMGARSANVLIDRLEKQKSKNICMVDETYYHIIQTSLVIRESVK